MSVAGHHNNLLACILIAVLKKIYTIFHQLLGVCNNVVSDYF
jgi:hypothetical protein